MTTFVLIHGGSVGGWIWKDAGAILRTAGHVVYAPSLGGCAELSPYSRRDITVGDHVSQIRSLIENEDLHDVVIVGHSYGGLLIPGIAAAVPERVKRAVYLDAVVGRSGERLVTALGFTNDEDAAQAEAELLAGERPVGAGLDTMMHSTFEQNPPLMSRERAQWLTERFSDMPASCTFGLVETGAEKLSVPARYVWARHGGMDAMRQRAEALGWPVVEYEGDHWFLFGDPRGTAALLEGSVG